MRPLPVAALLQAPPQGFPLGRSAEGLPGTPTPTMYRRETPQVQGGLSGRTARERERLSIGQSDVGLCKLVSDFTWFKIRCDSRMGSILVPDAANNPRRLLERSLWLETLEKPLGLCTKYLLWLGAGLCVHPLTSPKVSPWGVLIPGLLAWGWVYSKAWMSR